MRPTPHGPPHEGFHTHTHTFSLLWIMSIFRGDSWRGQLPSAPFSLPPHHHSQREERAGCQPDRTASQHPGVSTSSLVLQAPPPRNKGGKERRKKSIPSIHSDGEREKWGELVIGLISQMSDNYPNYLNNPTSKPVLSLCVPESKGGILALW